MLQICLKIVLVNMQASICYIHFDVGWKPRGGELDAVSVGILIFSLHHVELCPYSEFARLPSRIFNMP